MGIKYYISVKFLKKKINSLINMDPTKLLFHDSSVMSFALCPFPFQRLNNSIKSLLFKSTPLILPSIQAAAFCAVR